MESTAPYWKPVWGVLEQSWKARCQNREGARPTSGSLHLAQAQSNRAPRGRKRDFADAERRVKRFVAQELALSFMPDPEQRLWRTLMRRKYPMTCHRVRLQNQLEALLEEAHLKLSSLVSDLQGSSARRMLRALADGESNAAALAALADYRLRATPDQLRDALGACQGLDPAYRRLLHGSGGIATAGKAEGPDRARDGGAAPPSPGFGATAGGGTRPGSRLGAANRGRGRSPRRGLSFR